MLDIRIPYFHDMQLGRAYNKIMKTAEDWVLFIDHDILISLNPYYYSTCMKVIHEIGHKAGWVTCVTNRIAAKPQLAEGAPICDDVIKHMRYAHTLWKKNGDKITKINKGPPISKGVPFPGFSGFFMLTHKQAWEDAGGFKDGFLGVDNDYYHKLLNCGYDTYVMSGIYVYHVYRQKLLWDTF